MISYKKLFELMKKRGKNTSHIRNDNIIGQETLRKLKIGTGILEEYNYKIRTRETSVDSKSIESLCIWLDCQPNDIMEIIPNTWENADRLCDALSDKNHQVTPDELPSKLNMS